MYKIYRDAPLMDFCIEHKENLDFMASLIGYKLVYERYVVMYTRNAGLDIIKEPVIEFLVNESTKEVLPIYYQNDQLNYYMRAIDGNDLISEPYLYAIDSQLFSVGESLAIHGLAQPVYPQSCDQVVETLPEDLRKNFVYNVECGMCITAVPECLVAEAEEKENFDDYTVPVPYKYVLEKSYRMYKDHVIVDVPYSHELGLMVPEEFEEF